MRDVLPPERCHNVHLTLAHFFTPLECGSNLPPIALVVLFKDLEVGITW